jgi:hypothetical protein
VLGGDERTHLRRIRNNNVRNRPKRAAPGGGGEGCFDPSSTHRPYTHRTRCPDPYRPDTSLFSHSIRTLGHDGTKVRSCCRVACRPGWANSDGAGISVVLSLPAGESWAAGSVHCFRRFSSSARSSSCPPCVLCLALLSCRRYYLPMQSRVHRILTRWIPTGHGPVTSDETPHVSLNERSSNERHAQFPPRRGPPPFAPGAGRGEERYVG